MSGRNGGRTNEAGLDGDLPNGGREPERGGSVRVEGKHYSELSDKWLRNTLLLAPRMMDDGGTA